MDIIWRLEDSLRTCHMKDGSVLGIGKLQSWITEGLNHLKDFWDINIIQTTSPNSIRFRAERYSSTIAVYWDKKTNSVIFNNHEDVLFSEQGWKIAPPHEIGHKLISQDRHLDWPPYYDLAAKYNQPVNRWHHWMAIGAGPNFQGTFSPREVQYGVEKCGLKLNKRPIHPMAKEFNREQDPEKRAQMLPMLKDIVWAYGRFHARLYKWQTEGVPQL